MAERRLLPAKQVCQRYGGISPMTLWRWLNDPSLAFPRPIYIRGKRYFDLAELDEFDERQPSQAA